MESKGECKDYRESKGSKVYDDDEEVFYSDYKDGGDSKDDDFDVPQVNVINIIIGPKGIVPISSPLDLRIKFELDRDAVAAYWTVQFLVDSSHSRLIKVLGETPLEDYPDGESDMTFHADTIDVGGIEPSSLTNSGLLMAVFMVNGKEVATVNMVVQVSKRDGEIVREILSPLE
jgi:hypothetical protein